MTRIKICGITRLTDALAACEAGADAIGFVFAQSVRQMQPADVKAMTRHLPPFITSVGVFMDQPAERVHRIMEECQLDLAQLHGSESREYAGALGCRYVKSFRVKDNSVLEAIRRFGCRTFLLDAYSPDAGGGTGAVFDWQLALKAQELGNVILAGGLTPENVADALSKVQPYGVDVSSGVETSPGVKDREKIRQFIHEVRTWDYRTSAATSVSSADDLFLKR